MIKRLGQIALSVLTLLALGAAGLFAWGASDPPRCEANDPAVALANARAGAEEKEREFQNFHTSALVNLLILERGESLNSERVIEEIGSSIMVNIHYLLERHRETGEDPPDYVLPIWDEYLNFHRRRDADRQHQALHASHYSYLDPEEARFITPDIIETFCLIGEPEVLREKIEQLEQELLKMQSNLS